MVDEQVPMIAAGMTASYIAGMKSEREMLTHDILMPIFAAYTLAKDDPQARIPTALMAALECARAKFK